MTRASLHEMTRRALMAGVAPLALAQTRPAHPGAAYKAVFTLAAKPEPIAIDPAKAAVIVVDMQNDFGTKGGMFDRAGIDISMIQKAVGPTAKVLAAARQKGVRVVYLKMGFRPDLADLGSAESPNRVRHLRFRVGETVRAPDGRKSRILIRDTWNTDILAELKPHREDIVMYKNRFSGFYQTDLNATLKRMGVTHRSETRCSGTIRVSYWQTVRRSRSDTVCPGAITRHPFGSLRC